MGIFDFIKEELDGIRKAGLFRTLRTIEEGKGARVRIRGKEFINFCSNNYLGLAGHPEVIRKTKEILKKHGVGSGASRLVSGNFEIHDELEAKISKYEGTPASIVFPTGYMANLGTMQALVGAGDAVIIDRLNHASIIDGAKISGAKLLVYPHRDMEELEIILKHAQIFKKRLIVSDHVFSMDGDIAPAEKLTELAIKYKSMLMLDTAHSTGVLDLKIKNKTNVIIMGTLSKAIGSLGGFIAGSRDLIDYLKNKARSFIYTTGLPPAMAAASLASFDIIEKDSSYKEKLWDRVNYLKKKIQPFAFDTLGSETQIIPLVIGDARIAVDISNRLYSSGIFLSAIRPPTVPKGTSRLRMTVTAMHSKNDIDFLASKLKEIKEIYFG
jgi:glycine C-acetyltransferase/8-amino-7-oxononanoate synthase